MLKLGCSRSSLATVLAIALSACAGCYSTPRDFPANRIYMVRLEREFRQPFTEARQTELTQILADRFGTPDATRLPGFPAMKALFDEELLTAAAGPVGSDLSGRSRGLYREHCAACHGIEGNGIGPLAFVLYPYPRDFRRGIYKFKSTPKGVKPTHDDLRRILQNGIPGTGMPSYQSLPSWEIDSLAHYVRYLSMRGEAERKLIEYAAADLEPDEPLIDEDASEDEQASQQATVDAMVSGITQLWLQADSAVTPVPAPSPGRDLVASAARGRQLFFGQIANCVKCHGQTAEGDGQTTDYDDWTREIDPSDRVALSEYRKSGALGPRTITPRNLRLGIYHGGSRPEDLYRRIHNGIDGTPMPAALMKPADAPQETQGLTPDDVWCLVDYIRSLPGERTALAAEDAVPKAP